MSDSQRARLILKNHWPQLRCDIGLERVTPGFSGASVFRASGNDGEFCLRQWHAGMTQSRLAGIHRLLTHVAQAGVRQVPVPIADRDHSTFTEVDGRLWQLEPWMPGHADFCDDPSDARLERAMTVIAQWHLAAASVSLSDGDGQSFSSGPSSAVSRRIDLIRDYRSQLTGLESMLANESHVRFREVSVCIVAEFRRLSDRLLSRLNAVRDVAVPLQPCIRDLWHDHLLFTGNELTGLIDFGAVRTETIACDLARLLPSLLGNDRGGWHRALTAYEAVRPLRDEESRLIQPVAESGVLLSGMTWLKRRSHREIDSASLDRVCERLDHIAVLLREMAS